MPRKEWKEYDFYTAYTARFVITWILMNIVWYIARTLVAEKHSSLFLFYWMWEAYTKLDQRMFLLGGASLWFACFTRYLHPRVQSSATVSAQCKEEYGDETARSTTRQEGTMEGVPFLWPQVLLTRCCCSSYSCPFSCSSCRCRCCCCCCCCCRCCCCCCCCCCCGDVHDIRGSMRVLWLSDFNYVPWCFVRCGLLFPTD